MTTLNKQRRQEAAKARAEVASARTPQQQLQRLDEGGFVAKKERTKLAARMKKRTGVDASTR